jgi:hypothetical protein
MSKRPQLKPKLTDAERHKRFKDMARDVGASEHREDFDKAFDKVVDPIKPRGRGGNPPPT